MKDKMSEEIDPMRESELSDLVEAMRRKQTRAAGKLMERLAGYEANDRMLCEVRGYHRVAGISEKEQDENVCYDCFARVDKDEKETYRVIPRSDWEFSLLYMFVFNLIILLSYISI